MIDIDLWTTAANGGYLNHRDLQLDENDLQIDVHKLKYESTSLEGGERYLDAMDNWGGPFSSNTDDERYGSGSSSETSSSGNSNNKNTDPMASLLALKQSLDPNDENNDSNLSEYVRALLVEYTTDYVTSFVHSVFKTDERVDKGWSLVHAMNLNGELAGVDFREEKVQYLSGESGSRNGNNKLRGLQGNNDVDFSEGPESFTNQVVNHVDKVDLQSSKETFASLTFTFSGTAAVLQGKSIDEDLVKSTMSSSLYLRPEIGREELRLALRGAFAPPDGPYQFLSLVLQSATKDRLYDIPSKVLSSMSHSDRMEHDAALVLSGTREVKTRTDLDLYPQTPFAGQDDPNPHVNPLNSILWVSLEEAEKRESIAVFLEGSFLVLFIGGFYLYASLKYRRNYLKWELERYGSMKEEAVLFKHKYGNSRRGPTARIVRLMSGFRRNKKESQSPVTVEIDGMDGFFERESSGFDSEEDMHDLDILEESPLDYCEESSDLEKGLKASYDESNRNRRGLDMNPLDEGNLSRSPGSNTMKAMDDEMKESASSPSMSPKKIDWENVVPIPASDAVGRLDDKNATYQIGGINDGDGILVQRRYVQPASPFDVLYGAAFLHGEADRVEAQRRLKSQRKKIRASPSIRKRKKKKKTLTMKLVTEAMNGQRSKDAIKPMMTIAEVDDNGGVKTGIMEVFNEVEEDGYDSDEHAKAVTPQLSQLGPGELRHNTSTMSFYSPSNFMRNLSEKYNLGLFDPSNNSNNTAITPDGGGLVPMVKDTEEDGVGDKEDTSETETKALAKDMGKDQNDESAGDNLLIDTDASTAEGTPEVGVDLLFDTDAAISEETSGSTEVATKNNVDEGIAESAATVLLSEDLNTNMERTQNNSGTDEYVEATESVQKTENVATDKGEEANVDSTE